MDFDCQTVPLSRIRDDHFDYCISTGYATTDLIASIQSVGLINPPIVQPRDSEFLVVSGYGRIAACRALKWEEIPVRCVSPDAAFSDCALLAIADNASQRELNIVEMARAFGLLSQATGSADGQTPLQRLKAIGLSVNIDLGKKLDIINQMAAPLQEGLIDGTLALPTALRLHAMAEKEVVEVLCRIFKELNLSLNRQREILDWTHGIAMREESSMVRVLDEEPITGWLQDSQLDRGRKTHLIRDHLKRRRYPEIIRFEERYQRSLKTLNLSKGLRLEPPPHFEGPTFGVHISFKNQQELANLLGQLEQLSQSAAFSALLTPIK